MNDNIIPVNNEALSRAMVAVVGEDTAAVIVKSYKALDEAMVAGYKQGFKAAQEAQKAKDSEAEAQQKFLFDQAYEEGLRQKSEDQWEAGYAKGIEDSSPHAYDDGYIDGVSDARCCPSDADARVADLCRDDDFVDHDNPDFDWDPSEYTDETDWDSVNEYYEGDSGDEQPEPTVSGRWLSEQEWEYRQRAAALGLAQPQY